MQILAGLEYYQKLEYTIQQCVQQASQNPFQNYLFICEDKEFIEQLFFKHTSYLVNIELMTWNQFLNYLKNHFHLFHDHLVNITELTYHLRNLLKTQQFHCFQSNNPYPLIQEFIPLMKEYDLCHITYSTDSVNNKLKDFKHLYSSLIQSLDPYSHLSLESLLIDKDLANLNFHHIYIEADNLIQPKRQSIIHNLSKYYPLTCLYTYSKDSRLCNIPYAKLCQSATFFKSENHLSSWLFHQNPQSQKTNHYYSFHAATVHQEVKRVIYTIAQKIVDENLHYKDFAIVYPDSSYIDLLIDTCNEADIPHNLPIMTSCQYDSSYKKILDLCIGNKITSFHDIALQCLQEDLEAEYKDYFNLIQQFDGQLSPNEFRDFFKNTYQNNHQMKNESQDVLMICNINQLRLDKARHVFILGINETIFPRLIKDTSLLLDEDILTLRQFNSPTPLTTIEKQGLQQNNILKLLLQPFSSLTISYSQQTISGTTLLPSSLYKHLHQLYTFVPLPELHYLPQDQYYLSGGHDNHRVILNRNIQDFLNSKNQPQNLSKETTNKLYSPVLSVSQIETYNKCPFLYFVQYGLKVYPQKDKKLLPHEIGNLIHDVLYHCIDSNQNIHDCISHYVLQHDDFKQKIDASSVHQYFIEQLEKDLEITLMILKKQLDISSFEIKSKEQNISHQISHLQFKGIVDRIDEYQNHIAIIDYKSSAKDIDLNLAMQGFNIQMLVYLKMVTEKLHCKPGAILYFNTKKRILSTQQSLKDKIEENDFYKQYKYGGYIIDDEQHTMINAIDPHMDKRSDIIPVTYVKSRNEYKGQLLTEQQLNILIEYIEKHIYQLYINMCDGDIHISPKGSDQNTTHSLVNPCHYCPYHCICNFDVFYNEYDLVEFLDVDQLLGGEDNAV